jgi:hypothetical protein
MDFIVFVKHAEIRKQKIVNKEGRIYVRPLL